MYHTAYISRRKNLRRHFCLDTELRSTVQSGEAAGQALSRITVKDRIRTHFSEHFALNKTNYLFFATALAAGIFAGAFTAGCLDDSLRSEIAVIFANYESALKSGTAVSVFNVFFDNITAALRPLLFLTLCGFSFLAFAAGIFFLSVKGFAVGFFTAAAVNCMGFWQAVRLVLLSLPFQLISCSCLLAAAGVAAVHRQTEEKTAIYFLQMFLAALVLLAAVFLDFFIKSVFPAA